MSAVRLSTPHVVYDLQLDEVAAGGGLPSARPGPHRYIVETAAGPVAATEVQTDATGNATLVSTVNEGPFVQSTSRAFARLANEHARDATYEVRLLRFSALYLMAIWLKPETRGSDIIYPLAPAPAPLEADRAYAVDEFFAVIRPVAERQLRAASSRAPA